MLSNADKVARMMGCWQQEMPLYPKAMDSDTQNLRIKLIREEFNEVLEAFETGQTVPEVVKELCDLLTVTYGTLLTMGVNPDIAFNMVHVSNMSKLDSDGRPVFREDGKVMKGENYKPPQMEDILAVANF